MARTHIFTATLLGGTSSTSLGTYLSGVTANSGTTRYGYKSPAFYAVAMAFLGNSNQGLSIQTVSGRGPTSVVLTITNSTGFDYASPTTGGTYYPLVYGPKAYYGLSNSVANNFTTTSSSEYGTYAKGATTVTLNFGSSLSVNGYSIGKGDSNKTNRSAIMSSAVLTVVTSEIVYYVYYNANGGSSTPATQSAWNYGGNAFTLAAAIARTGYTFGGWNTNASGTGTNYAAGTAYTFTAESTTLYANWTINSSSLSVNPNGGSWNGSASSQSFTQNYNTTLSISNPTRIGYTFTGWARTNTYGTLSGTTYTFGPTGGVTDTLTAQWQINSSTLTVYPNGGTWNGSTDNQSFLNTYNATLSIPLPVRSGYTFTGWVKSGTFYGALSSTTAQATYTYSATAGITDTITAGWSVITYTILYNANGGSSAPTSQIKTWGTNLTLSSTVPVRTGYTFLAWNTSVDGSGTSYSPGAAYSSEASATLYAQWQVNTYTVSFDSNGGSSVASKQVVYGTTYGDLATPTKASSYFQGWFYAGVQIQASTTMLVASNHTLVASWQEYYTITYDANGGSGAPESQIKNPNVDLTLSSTVPVWEGHYFIGWALSPTAESADYAQGGAYTDNASATLYALWDSIDQFTVSYNANGGSGAPASQIKVEYEPLTLSSTIPTYEGRTFVSWNTAVDGTGTPYAPGDIYATEASLQLYAQWLRNTYTVTYKANHGSVPDQTQSITYGVTWTTKGTSDFSWEGHTLLSWNTSADGTGTNYAIDAVQSVYTNLTLYAQWQTITYIIHYNANNGSSDSLNEIKTWGVDITLLSSTAFTPPLISQTLDSWNTSADGTGTSYQPGASYSANAGLVLYAQWVTITYTISYNANGGGEVPSDTTFEYGTSTNVSTLLPTRSGWSYLTWNTQADGLGTSYYPGEPYATNANLALYAIWIKLAQGTIYIAARGSLIATSSAYIGQP